MTIHNRKSTLDARVYITSELRHSSYLYTGLKTLLKEKYLNKLRFIHRVTFKDHESSVPIPWASQDRIVEFLKRKLFANSMMYMAIDMITRWLNTQGLTTGSLSSVPNMGNSDNPRILIERVRIAGNVVDAGSLMKIGLRDSEVSTLTNSIILKSITEALTIKSP